MPVKPPETFGQLLKRFRRKAKLTQTDVAISVRQRGGQLSQGYVSLIERTAGTAQEPDVSREIVVLLSSVLGINRETALLSAGHNPKSPKKPPEDGEYMRLRILAEFEIIAPDGSSRILPLSELTPAMRRALADLLLLEE
jgi:transcriptional regulator with XRE-family HTH domain